MNVTIHTPVVHPPKVASGRPQARSQDKLLTANPLFAAGADYDEFHLTPRNVGFAVRNFGLDPAIQNLVGPPGTRLSVVYHTANDAVAMDALRLVASAGQGAVFSAYDVKNPAFDPTTSYTGEMHTDLGKGRFFGTRLATQRLAVPQNATPALKNDLLQQGYLLKESVPLQLPQALKDGFGLPSDIDIYELPKSSFGERFKILYRLFKEDPQYRILKIGDTMGDIGSAMLLGVVTPKLWEQGAAYGIASTVAYIHQGDRYLFDSGWEVTFEGKNGHLVQEDESHFSISFDDGRLTVKNSDTPVVDVQQKRRAMDYVPLLNRAHLLGEKQSWVLKDADDSVRIARYGASGYSLQKLSDQEYVVCR